MKPRGSDARHWSYLITHHSSLITLFITLHASLFTHLQTAHAHHGQNFFATATADTVHPGANVFSTQAVYFRPELGPSTGQRIEIAPVYIRGLSEDFHLETHLHWLTNPAEGLDLAQGVFEGFAIGGRHRLADIVAKPESPPFRLAVAAQIDVPTAYAMKTLGSGPGGIFHLVLSRTSADGFLFAANMGASVFAHLACAGPTQDASVAAPFRGASISRTEVRAYQDALPGAPRRHAPLDTATCDSRVPMGVFEWGFSLAVRKNLTGNLDAGAEFAKEVEYPPGMSTIIGFFWAPEPEWLVRWGVAFPVGLDEDLISLRLGAAVSF
ncbi:MAG: hypothetical protein HYT87_11900 [Nitrospirae bacterium]|nr:hypothetical protein [Nitrospirota bacterium]